MFYNTARLLRDRISNQIFFNLKFKTKCYTKGKGIEVGLGGKGACLA